MSNQPKRKPGRPKGALREVSFAAKVAVAAEEFMDSARNVAELKAHDALILSLHEVGFTYARIAEIVNKRFTRNYPTDQMGAVIRNAKARERE